MQPPRVLIVDDQIGDLTWLLDVIRSRGSDVALATNEDAARQRLEAVRGGTESYAFAIIDVMVATKDLFDLVSLDYQFFEDSRDTGIRLCRYARLELKLSARELPIACLTVREDRAVKDAMEALDIPLYNRVPSSPAEGIRGFVERHLPGLSKMAVP